MLPPRCALIACAALSGLVFVNAVPTSQSSHGHGHNSLLSNGQSCNMSNQCQSSYCHHGSCDDKKPNGHQCYKDNGCLSGRCDHKKCSPSHSHPSSGPNAPAESSSMTSATVTTATTATPVSTGTTATTATSTSTATTPAYTSGILSFRSKAPGSDTPVPYTSAAGGYLAVYDMGFYQSQLPSNWKLDHDSNLIFVSSPGYPSSPGVTHYIVFDGRQYFSDTDKTTAGQSLVKCTPGANIADTYDGRPGTVIQCSTSLDGQTYTRMIICNEETIVENLQSCNEPEQPGNQEVFQLTLGA